MKQIFLYLSFLVSVSFFYGCGAHLDKSIVILENGLYFNGDTFKPFREIIIRSGKILSIGSTLSNVNGKRIDVNGKYVIPGLVDAHVHCAGCPSYPYVETDSKYNLHSSLRCGVTTNFDLFYRESECRPFKYEISKKPTYYSSVVMAGPILTAPEGHGTEYGIPTREITSVQAAEKITNEVIDSGADVIKLVYQGYSSVHTLTKEMVKKIVLVAHSRNKIVFAHIDLAAEAIDCADAGVDILAHMPVDSLTNDQLCKLKASGVVIVPTITVYQSLFEGHDASYMSDSLLWKTANPAYLNSFGHSAILKMDIPEEWIVEHFHSIKYRENLANCIKMNIPIIAGTDAGNYAVFYGYSLHNELFQYVNSGMSNAEAMCSATQNITLKFTNMKIGRIKEGYDADLVILSKNPLKNIENTKSIEFIIHKGLIVK